MIRMPFIPEHGIGFQNAWWFSLLYGMITLIMMLCLSKEQRTRILTFPTFRSHTEKILSGLAIFLFGRGLIVYSLFIPLTIHSRYFSVGTGVYLIGMIASVSAMWIFSQAELSHPVTQGIYRITRHPMQVMAIIMWIGVGIASRNWIFIVCAVLLGILSPPSLQAQERFCIEKYGEEYIEYMNKTPRYLVL
jgi:protein-S-isoprenylcysteine O-methyltransferase Ste14